MARRSSPFTETGELTSVGKMLAVRTLVLAVLMSLIGISTGSLVLAVVLPVLAIALPGGFMLYLRKRAKTS